MKIVLAGAGGFVGTEVLEQCIAHRFIHHVFCLDPTELARKYSTHKKVTQLVRDYSEEYDEPLLNTLRNAGVDGCIWAVESQVADFKTVEEAQKAGITYPTQAADAFAAHLATALSPSAQPNTTKFPFRFVFLSSWGAEQDPHRGLWIWSEDRKIKGAAEKALFEIADQSQEVEGKKCFEAIALRAGTVLGKEETTFRLLAESTTPSISVHRLARCAIKTVLQGTDNPSNRILENKDCLGDDWGMVNTLTL